MSAISITDGAADCAGKKRRAALDNPAVERRPGIILLRQPA